ncbi:MAG: 2-amino-4-hydroxy-6-hydroxymethyldihydropteridine diphosphokinase [Desulfuromonadaceae bacterium GWC2_58_13]|nr:MAG: 2-amino-4-hydroxy-6-hydroxymethyldihydropteridine diphosphokinase [Desulfuromonadaceae bacterium GWC2_58_13]
MTTAYLALGANLGDRLATFRQARAALDQQAEIKVTGASAIFETEPVGGPAGQNVYLNAVLRVDTTLAPQVLLAVCQTIELHFGRRREVPWGPRTLDIDLLLYGEVTCGGPQLILPHPRLHLRRFVLTPLLELAPDLRHPLLGQTIRELHAALDDPAAVRRLDDHW